MTKIFDGRKFAQEKEKLLAKKVADFKAKTGITPKLVSIVVGSNPASHLYLKHKQQSALRIGIAFEKIEFPENAQAEEIIRKIREKNQDKKTHGIMVQLPLPEELRVTGCGLRVLDTINPEKDVDCLTQDNFDLLEKGKPRFLPATVKAVIEVIRETRHEIRGVNVCVAGASKIVGKPLAIMLSNMGASVTVCRSKTTDLAEQTKKADILISATGVPSLIKPEMVKTGAVVIDVGSPKGDVDPSTGSTALTTSPLRASFFTPVPGGVGPVTIVCLMENTLQAAEMMSL